MTWLFTLLVVALAGGAVALLNGDWPAAVGCAVLVLASGVGVVSTAAARRDARRAARWGM